VSHLPALLDPVAILYPTPFRSLITIVVSCCAYSFSEHSLEIPFYPGRHYDIRATRRCLPIYSPSSLSSSEGQGPRTAQVRGGVNASRALHRQRCNVTSPHSCVIQALTVSPSKESSKERWGGVRLSTGRTQLLLLHNHWNVFRCYSSCMA
jgi:hypothetical protein